MTAFNTGLSDLAAASEIAFMRALGETARVVEAKLDWLLPDIPGDRLRSAMRYAALGGGKRLRPFLSVQSAALFNVALEKALRVGAAIECLHCYSLVHDDLPAMDDDDLRRGSPTVHRAFDEATAILAGDGLQALAFEILADVQTHEDAAVRSTLVLELAKAAGERGMVGGQMLDLLAEEKPFADYAEVAAMQGKKTGALIRFSCEAGAILGGADRSALAKYGEAIGLAFQIADDVLDIESDAVELGKATQKDKGKGKATFVDLLGLDGAKREAARLTDEAIAALAGYGEKAELLREAARYVISRRS
jgi:farnesyl diphosphate synthase